MTPSPTHAARPMTPPWAVHVAALAGGAGFTFAIAAGLALFARQVPPPEVQTEVGIRSVDAPEPPPPPPPRSADRGPSLPPAPLLFEHTVSASTVHLTPTPIPLVPLIPEVRPTFSLRFDFAPGQFRPEAGTWEPDARHVFQPKEVDQRVVAVYRKIPDIPSGLLKAVKVPRVRVLFVVNTDGTVEDLRVLMGAHPELDRLIAEAVSQWRFRPAVRRGKKVRCIAEMPVYVQAPTHDPFSTN